MSEEKENKVLVDKPQKKIVEGNKAKDKKTVSVDKSKSINWLSFIVPVVLLLIISIPFVFLNDRLNNIEKEFNQSNIKINSTHQHIDNQIKDSSSRLSSMQKKLEEFESKQDVLSRLLSQPQEQQVHINKDYALAEIEHLLIIATYNLQLGHDVATALAAMEAADARLNGFSDPAVLSVREQLITDMNDLRSLNQADLSGLSLFLSDLISRVDELALKENIMLEKAEINSKPNEEQVKGVKHFFMLVFKELKSLIVITRDQSISKARLLPDEIYFLKANLKLELANARFSVFNRDTDNLHASIGHIQLWLNEYFDLSNAAVRNVYDALSRMKKLELAFPDVDISSSLESVRALSRSQDESYDTNNEEGLIPLQ
jgi:uroporphyrin-III C-methyltransferase